MTTHGRGRPRKGEVREPVVRVTIRPTVSLRDWLATQQAPGEGLASVVVRLLEERRATPPSPA